MSAPAATVAALAKGLAAGDFSSVELTRSYLDRIRRLNRASMPSLR